MGDNPKWKRRERLTVKKAIVHNRHLAEYAREAEKAIKQLQDDAERLRVEMMNAAIIARTHITFTMTPGAFRARRQLDAMIRGLRDYRRNTPDEPSPTGPEGKAEAEGRSETDRGQGPVPTGGSGDGEASGQQPDRNDP